MEYWVCEVEAREEGLGVARGGAGEPGARRERQAVERRDRPRLAKVSSSCSKRPLLLGQEHLGEDRRPVAVVGRHLVGEVEGVVGEVDLSAAAAVGAVGVAAVLLLLLFFASLKQQAATAAVSHVVPGVLAAERRRRGRGRRRGGRRRRRRRGGRAVVVPGVLAAPAASASAVVHRRHVVTRVLVPSSGPSSPLGGVVVVVVMRHGVHHVRPARRHVRAHAHLHRPDGADDVALGLAEGARGHLGAADGGDLDALGLGVGACFVVVVVFIWGDEKKNWEEEDEEKGWERLVFPSAGGREKGGRRNRFSIRAP